MRPHDGRQTHPLEDEFFRQLAGGSLADTEVAPAARPRRRRPETPRGATDPHAPHPIGGAEVGPDSNEAFRPREAPQGPPPPAPRRRGRLAACASLAVVMLAVALVVFGGGEERGPADGDHGVPNGSPASDEARLRVGWGADKAARLRARWRRGGRAIIAGRLPSAVSSD